MLAAQVSYLQVAVASIPAGPGGPPSEQKRSATHHAAARRTAQALLVNAASPRGYGGPT